MEKVPISSYPYNSEDLSGHVSRSTTLLMFMINSEGLNRFTASIEVHRVDGSKNI